MTAPSHCPTHEQLTDYLEGLLDRETRAWVHQHLVRCKSCRKLISAEGGESQLPLAEGSMPTIMDGMTRSFVFPSGRRLSDDLFDETQWSQSADQSALGRLGKYDIYDLIGHGGMGVVFRARDQELERTVAIKVLIKELAQKPVARKRFVREAKAAAAINHPNIVTIHDIGHQNDTPFIVFEYIDGPSLRDHIRTHKQLPPEEVIRLSAQIAVGLAAAHAQGVIHRDIKPANVMLDEGIVRVKIMDFGLARAVADNVDLTSQDLAVGTPSYMSPEQVRGERLDARTDLFSLGCVMYAMAQGHSPFRGTNALDSVCRVRDHHTQPLHETDPSFPKALSDVVSRLLEKDPARRFASALDTAVILNKQLSAVNQALSSELSETLQHLPRPRESRRRTAWWLVAPLLLLLGGAIFLASRYLPTGTESVSTVPTVNNGDGASGSGILESEVKSVQVSKSGDADYQTISEAIAALPAGGTITVLDDARYEEGLSIDGRKGLSIISPNHATLVHPAGPYGVIGISDSTDTLIQGLEIETHARQYALLVRGDCSGLVIDDVRCRTPSDWSQVLINRETHGAVDSPIVIRNCHFITNALGICLLGDENASIGELLIEGNRFEGPGKQLQLNGNVYGVQVKGNVFIDGGLHFNFRSSSIRDITVVHNTFYTQSQSSVPPKWMIIGDAPPNLEGIHICENAIIGDLGYEVLVDLTSLCQTWNIRDNRWQVGTRISRQVAEPWGDVISDARFVSTSPDSPDFLRPAEGSELIWKGTDANWKYAGAIAPQTVEDSNREDNDDG